MSTQDPDRPPPELGRSAYDELLRELRKVGDKALDRLRELRGHLPGRVVEQVEKLHDNPARERRKSARVRDPSVPVVIWAVDLPEGSAQVKDHCPTGLAVSLSRPAEVGSVLRVEMPPELGGGWVDVEVRYCRQEEQRWVAGCELLRGQPPI